MQLSLVLPCYNEEGNIEQTLRDCVAWLTRDCIEGEVIAVDDGSTDGTVALLESLAREFPLLRIIRHERNLGYGAAVRSGCDAARTGILCFMDSDGQFRPGDFQLLLAHLDNYPFVAGRRRRRADPLVRII